MTAFRDLVLRCVPMTTYLGVVRKFPGETSHYEILIDENGNRDIMVDVELVPRSERVLCRMGFGHDQIFKIPRVNQEVAVLVPSARGALIADELDFDPIIVGVLDTNQPAELDGDDVVVITAPRVIMLSNTIQLGENAEPLATKADVQAVRDALNGHAHTYIPGSSAAVLTTGNPSVPAPSGTSKVTGE